MNTNNNFFLDVFNHLLKINLHRAKSTITKNL